MASPFSSLWADRIRDSMNCFRRSPLNHSHNVSFHAATDRLRVSTASIPRTGTDLGRQQLTQLLCWGENIQAAPCSSSLDLMICWPDYRERLSNSYTTVAWFGGCCFSSVIAIRNARESLQLSNIMFWDTAVKRLQPGISSWKHSHLANRDLKVVQRTSLRKAENHAPRAPADPKAHNHSLNEENKYSSTWCRGKKRLKVKFANRHCCGQQHQTLKLRNQNIFVDVAGLINLLVSDDAPFIPLHFPIKQNLSSLLLFLIYWSIHHNQQRSFLRMKVLTSVAVIPVFILNDWELCFDKKLSFSHSLYLSNLITITNVSSPLWSTTWKPSTVSPQWDNRISVGEQQAWKGIPG